jgi:limonene-1,2-epoxide hydrolase
MRFWVYGRFTVREGRIAIWRDSFAWFDRGKATFRGLLGLGAAKLNRSVPGCWI